MLEELGRAASVTAYLGTAVLGVGALDARAAQPGARRAARAGRARCSDRRRRPRCDRRRGPGGAAVPPGAVRWRAPPARPGRAGARRRRGRPAAPAGRGPRPGPGARAVTAGERRGGAPCRWSTPPGASAPSPPTASWSPTMRSGRSPATGPQAAQQILDRAAVAVACDAMGLAGAMLDATVAYLGERRAVRPPDRLVPGGQARLRRPAGASSPSAGSCSAAAIDAVAAGDPGAGRAAARAKSFVTAAAVDVVGEALQLHGAHGLQLGERPPRVPEAGHPRPLAARRAGRAPPPHRRRPHR